ncbi:MAG: hypothetical protein CMP10_01710 [Zetaproteobacteria bacterium]|nr:hypothetical protein [Pseudobdellovibrionaceae bacterium]
MKYLIPFSKLLLFILVGISSISLYGNPKEENKNLPAQDGVVDLAKLKISDRGKKLAGEWKFVYEKFLTPEEILKHVPQDIPNFSVPGTFTGAGLDPQGYGTFYITFRNLNPENGDLGLLMGHFLINGDFYWAGTKDGQIIFNEKIGQIGTVTNKPDEWIGQYRQVISKLRTTERADQYLLIFHHSSYLSPAGYPDPVRLASYTSLIKSDSLQLWQTFLVLGMLFMITVYNCSLFTQRRDDLGSLYISLYAILMGIRYISTEGLLSRFFIEPSLVIQYINFLGVGAAFPLGMALFLSFLNESFRGCYSDKITKGVWIYCLLVVFGQLFFTVTAIAISPLTVVAIPLFGIGGYCIYGLVKAARQKMRGALLSILGMTILVYGFFHDTFVFYGDLSIPFVAHYCLVAFTFIQSTITGINFAFAFRTAEHLSRQLTIEVERQTRDIKSILTNIHQGIFTVDRNPQNEYIVGPDYSKFLGDILETNKISNRTVQELLLNGSDLSREARDMVKSTFDFVVGEPSFAFEMNEECFPKGFNLVFEGDKNKIIKAEWSPIVNEKTDTIEKVLVSLRDVTELAALEEKSREHQKEITIISEIVHLGIDKFALFCRSGRQFIEENKRLISAMTDPDEEVLKVLFINMHTVKGAARTYALTPITEVVHHAEQYYASLQRKEEAFSHQKLIDEIHDVEIVFEQYESIFHNKLGFDNSENKVEVNLDTLRNSVEALQALEGEVSMGNEATSHFSSIRNTLYDLYFLKAVNIFEDMFSNLERLARDLQKPEPNVVIELENLYLTHETGKILGDCFTHILRNSMDHGIEDEETRKKEGKDPKGTMRLIARHFNEYSVLEFSDDGAGLNLDRIRKRALANQLIESEDKIEPTEIAELIFNPGFSTAQTVSQISGRGVGMDAIRTYLREINGEVSIQLLDKAQQEGIPFALCITIPQPFCQYLGESQEKVA